MIPATVRCIGWNGTHAQCGLGYGGIECGQVIHSYGIYNSIIGIYNSIIPVCIAVTYIVTAYIIPVYIVVTYIVTACIVMNYVVVVYIVMAYIVMESSVARYRHYN